MISVDIEKLAEDIRNTFSCKHPPVDVLKIAEEEGILLAPGNFGPDFCGRIEFHRPEGKFILFYPETVYQSSQARARFSIGHELGHYYIPEHRDALLRGLSHNSTAGFICSDTFEREADEFAAALLVPRSYLDQRLNRRGFLTLKEVSRLAAEWKASLTSTAIRYVKYTPEACAVVLSQRGRILYYIASDELAASGFKRLSIPCVPRDSATAILGAGNRDNNFLEGSTTCEAWFPAHWSNAKVWEESFPLGYTNIVLTLLSFENLAATRE